MATSLRELAERFDVLFDAWERADRQLYLVGGCVRDVLMASEAIGDIDLATDALPDETTAILQRAGFPAYPIGARFGTISTIVDGTPIEITTFRVEEQYEAGNRKPNVTFGKDLRHDLSRRDLSLNAMAAGRGGTLYDPFDGQGAIRDGILEVPDGGFENTVGILRDDPLRLLRIARFAARFGFRPTDETTAAAKVTSRELEAISHERWKMELDKTLVAPKLADGILWLDEVGALQVIAPSLGLVEGSGEALARALERTDVNRITRWAVLFYAAASCRAGKGIPQTDGPVDNSVDSEFAAERAWRAAKHFRFSNEELAMVRALCGGVISAGLLGEPWTRVELRRFLARWRGLWQAATDLSFAWSSVDAARYAVVRGQLARAFVEEDFEPVLPLGFGRLVIDALGFPRGPAVSAALDRLRSAMIDGELANGADEATCLAFLESERASLLGDG